VYRPDTAVAHALRADVALCARHCSHPPSNALVGALGREACTDSTLLMHFLTPTHYPRSALVRKVHQDGDGDGKIVHPQADELW